MSIIEDADKSVCQHRLHPQEQKTRKGISSTVSAFGGLATLFHPIELMINSSHHGAGRSKRA
jgi:hypothetical protein